MSQISSKQTFCKAFGSVKSWGMSFSPCWWACDIKRSAHVYFVTTIYSHSFSVAAFNSTTKSYLSRISNHRCLRSNPEGNGFYNVVIDIGDGTMKVLFSFICICLVRKKRFQGFTTANLQAFLTVLRRQCNPGVICQEGFPW